MSEKLVCVTGGSGFIASWLVKLLLHRGYTVRASVRDPSDPKKTEHLRALDRASERLHLFKADLLEEGSFDTAIAGCVGVFHTASPVFYNATDFQSELIEPAVKGTLNVLKSCAKASSVKRVVMTSSMTAVIFNGRSLNPDVVVDETWYSDPDFCTKNKRRRREMSEKVVCVTGGSGFIASWLVKLLLHRGYTVRATVLDPSDPKQTEHLRGLDGASERLHLFKADLLEEGCFDNAIAGCVGVFHTACPVFSNPTDFQPELIEPAVKGTLNVLKSCAKASSVNRVVMTSSMCAVTFNGRSLNPDVVVDETWYSEPDFCIKNKLWYHLSKTLAEEAAWKFSKENGVELVTINPGMVIGHLLQPTLNLTNEFIYKLVSGSTTFPNSTKRWINVKDVAMAHILAYEIPSANGRYCLAEKVTHNSEVVEIIHKLYPSIPVPEKCADDKPFKAIYQVSKEKARSLGLNFIPLEESVKETIESLKEKGFITF
ncbi:hypothetical protein LUZ62_086114 [Rhynchospora pubera]|uniref:3-beta hydroxysteroid dehydrogenase/isomerase domain-containing protein n=1 Tax=Rhynchospora pubera TaxID=906938 RepID=A0AAV8C800_9POAL|nr:hypothetical protein LUZ62_086114 [Rhynchospora pubera]